MKRLAIIMSFISSTAYAGEDLICEKKPMNDHVVYCKAKKSVSVSLININGGECLSPPFFKQVVAGSSFNIPGTKECYHTRSITLSVNGKKQIFAPL